MNDNQVDAMVKIGTIAAELLIDYLSRPPADPAERAAQDRAALALIDQAQRAGDAVRARLGVADTGPGGLAEPPAAGFDVPDHAPWVPDAPGVDFAFLASCEGTTLRGYVPTHRSGPLKGKAIGASGVTVGMGVDLGRRNEGDLADLGLDADVIAQLAPYLGLQRDEAIAALRARPLLLSEADWHALDAAIAGELLGRLVRRWRKAHPEGPSFAELPDEAQTVLASVTWQYGDVAKACPRLWAAACACDWPAVVAELEDFGDDYAPRRRREAAVLRPVAGRG